MKDRMRNPFGSYTNPNQHTSRSTILDPHRNLNTGLSPDAPTVENERGGKQSQVEYRFDLIDQNAIFAMAQVLHEGAFKYGANN